MKTFAYARHAWRQGFGRRGWKMTRMFAFFVALMTGWAVHVEAETIPLALNGVPQMDVAIPSTASTEMQQSAEELASFLNQITGGTFAVVTYDPAQGPGPGIVLGLGTDLGLEAEVPAPGSNSKAREHHIIATGNNGAYVLLAGATDIAVTNAVYDFLERLNCRWYFASANWEIIPDAPTLQWVTPSILRTTNAVMGQTNVSVKIYADESPDFKMRHIWFAYTGTWEDQWVGGEDMKVWQRQNRSNRGLNIAAGHAYEGIKSWAVSHSLWDDLYSPLIDGERNLDGTKFCISNAGLQAMGQAYAQDYFNDDPDYDTVSFDPSDSGGWCQCEPCRAIDDERDGFVTERVVTLANAAAGVIPAGKYVGHYAYFMHSAPPAIVMPAANVYTLVATAYTGGQSVEELLGGWSQVQPNMGIREYFGVLAWSHDLPGKARGANLAYLTQKIPYYHAYNVDVLSAESTSAWGPCGLGYYIANKLLWNVDADVEALKADFLDRCFGAAASPMGEFYELSNGGNKMPVSDHLMGQLFCRIDAARNLESDPAVVARLDDLTLWLRYCELWRIYSSSPSAQRTATGEAMLRFAWRIRRNNMMDSLALWRTVNNDPDIVWPEGCNWKTDPAEHPWKDDVTYSHQDIVQMNEDGIANNPLLPAEPKAFSADLVPSGRAAGTRGNTSFTRGGVGLYLYTDPNGVLPVLSISTGYSYPYNGEWTLYRVEAGEVHEDEDSIVEEGTIPPDKATYNVVFGDHGPGCYYFSYNDDTASSKITWPAGARVSYSANVDRPLWLSGTVTRRYFYVPKGTEYVMAHADYIFACNFYSAGGALKHSQPYTTGGLDIVIPVGPGEDDQIWYVTSLLTKDFFFWNIPGLLANRADELLIPREAYANLIPSGQSASTGGNFNYTRGKVHIYLYPDNNGDLPNLTITSGHSYNLGDSTWELYPAGGGQAVETGTVPQDRSTCTVTFGTHPVGGYHLVFDDQYATSKISWAAGSRASFRTSPDEFYWQSSRVTRRYFYVPKGTDFVQAWAENIADCNFYTANGTHKLAQPPANGGVDINLQVGAGEDGQIWYVTGFAGQNFYFRNIPGYLAPNTDELLVPQWVYHELEGN